VTRAETVDRPEGAFGLGQLLAHLPQVVTQFSEYSVRELHVRHIRLQ
jgi:hypothetical protein